MLHSVCNCFNSQTLDIYLDACWQKVNQKEIGSNRIETMIHICSAHIMNCFSYKIEHKLRPTKETKRVMMFIMADYKLYNSRRSGPIIYVLVHIMFIPNETP